MGIFSGLEKFGLDASKMNDLYATEEAPKRQQPTGGEKEEKPIPKESEFLLEKTVTCPVCDKTFKVKVVKSGKAKRLEPDRDLRPRFQYIDTLKYDVFSCPHCGYSGLASSYMQLSPLQRKLIKESVCDNFDGGNAANDEAKEEYDYNTAIDRCKLALFNSMVKKGKISEKAYLCLKISWLYRGKCEVAIERGNAEDSDFIKKNRQEERKFYEEAYDGLVQASEKENPPICGMDENTLDLLLAEMGYILGKYDVSSRFVARVMASSSASRNAKDKALELKQDILAALHKK